MKKVNTLDLRPAEQPAGRSRNVQIAYWVFCPGIGPEM
jgi:hypothetical protein